MLSAASASFDQKCTFLAMTVYQFFVKRLTGWLIISIIIICINHCCYKLSQLVLNFDNCRTIGQFVATFGSTLTATFQAFGAFQYWERCACGQLWLCDYVIVRSLSLCYSVCPISIAYLTITVYVCWKQKGCEEEERQLNDSTSAAVARSATTK